MEWERNGLHPAALSILLALSLFFVIQFLLQLLSLSFFSFFFFGAKHHVLLPAPARSTDGTALNIPVDSGVICHHAKIGIQFTSTRNPPKTIRG